ncbi:MAG: DUF3466 family protein [Thermomicrobiales bacterium]
MFRNFISGAAVDINESGQIAGHVDFSDGSTRAFLWQEGAGLTDLGTLDGPRKYVHTFATAINDSGKIVGFVNDAGNGGDRAFFWEDGRMIDLGTLEGGERSRAEDINNAGQIVGWSENQEVAVRAFIWDDGQMTDLGALEPNLVSEATGINDTGQVVGSSSVPGRSSRHATLWQDGKIFDLGTLNPNNGNDPKDPYGMRDWSDAAAINAAGQIVGTASTGEGESPFGDSHPFLWQTGQMTDLSQFGGHYALPHDINDTGLVVGGGPVFGDDDWENAHAVLWQDGVMIDLTTQGWNGCCALALNEGGQIVGVGETERGEHRPVIWQDGVMRELDML